MNLPRVIGLTGLKRSGKTTLARELSALGYKDVAFADPLKDLAVRLDPILTGDTRLSQVIDAYGWEYAKDHYPESRRILQFLGTEVVREVNPDHWVNKMRQKICINHPDKKFVVSDVRFENEADVVRECGGIVVEIIRPGLSLPTDSHSSESGVCADWVIYNTGTKDELLSEFLKEVSDL